MMLLARTLLALVLLTAPLAPARAQAEDAQAIASDALDLMAGAATLFDAGRRDEATVQFYLGQLRFRALLATEPGLEPWAEPAAFDAIFATVGPPINEWAFGDIPHAVALIDQVLAEDEAAPDLRLPAAALEEARAGLRAFRDTMLRDADQLRAQRAANGLPNR